MKKHQNPVIYLLAILLGFMLSMAYINPYGGKISLSELILQLSGSRGTFVLEPSPLELLGFAMRIFPAWILEVFLGVSLYQHFCTASIYIFSRCSNRKKWYWKEISVIGCHVLLFHAILLGTAILTALFRYSVSFHFTGILLLLYHLVLHSLWSYSIIILINIFALKFGSSIAFLSVLIAQTIEISLLGIVKILENLFEITEKTKSILLQLNPMSHLVLGWQRSLITKLDTIQVSAYEGFYLENSLILLISMCIGSLFIGAKIIEKYDLLVSDSEISVI